MDATLNASCTTGVFWFWNALATATSTAHSAQRATNAKIPKTTTIVVVSQASKAASDLLVRAYHHTYGLPTVITFTVFFAAAEQYEAKTPRLAFAAYENALFLERCETEELHLEALRRLQALAKRIGDEAYLSALTEVKWPRQRRH